MEAELPDGNKKRKRKPYRPGEHTHLSVCCGLALFSSLWMLGSGIGGFMVRQRGGKVGVSRIKLCRRDSSELLSRDEGEAWTPPPPAVVFSTITVTLCVTLRCFHGDHTAC